MKPVVKHEHTVEVTIPAVFEEKAAKVKEHIEANKKPYAFGAGGIVIGFAVARIFARPSINIVVNTTEM